MFNKEKILELINQDGLYIDGFIFDAFIKNWKIDPIYEDENGVEYYDELTVEKIKSGISQKNQSKCEIHIMDKDDVTPVEMAVEAPVDVPADMPDEEYNEENYQEEDIQEEVISEAVITDTESAPMDLPVEIKKEVEAGLKNITVDVSNQTLAALAQSIAGKITKDVSEYLKNSDFIKEAVNYGEIKHDNKILVEKMEEMLEDNKILVSRIKELEKENASFVKLFGNVYIKN